MRATAVIPELITQIQSQFKADLKEYIKSIVLPDGEALDASGRRRVVFGAAMAADPALSALGPILQAGVDNNLEGRSDLETATDGAAFLIGKINAFVDGLDLASVEAAALITKMIAARQASTPTAANPRLTEVRKALAQFANMNDLALNAARVTGQTLAMVHTIKAYHQVLTPRATTYDSATAKYLEQMNAAQLTETVQILEKEHHIVAPVTVAAPSASDLANALVDQLDRVFSLYPPVQETVSGATRWVAPAAMDAMPELAKAWYNDWMTKVGTPPDRARCEAYVLGIKNLLTRAPDEEALKQQIERTSAFMDARLLLAKRAHNDGVGANEHSPLLSVEKTRSTAEKDKFDEDQLKLIRDNIQPMYQEALEKAKQVADKFYRKDANSQDGLSGKEKLKRFVFFWYYIKKDGWNKAKGKSPISAAAKAVFSSLLLLTGIVPLLTWSALAINYLVQETRKAFSNAGIVAGLATLLFSAGSIAGGAYAGAVLGALIGTVVFPGIGTAIGMAIFGIAGAVAGAALAGGMIAGTKRLVNKIATEHLTDSENAALELKGKNPEAINRALNTVYAYQRVVRHENGQVDSETSKIVGDIAADLRKGKLTSFINFYNQGKPASKHINPRLFDSYAGREMDAVIKVTRDNHVSEGGSPAHQTVSPVRSPAATPVSSVAATKTGGLAATAASAAYNPAALGQGPVAAPTVTAADKAMALAMRKLGGTS